MQQQRPESPIVTGEHSIIIIIIIINPLTVRVVGAPQMLLQPVFPTTTKTRTAYCKTTCHASKHQICKIPKGASSTLNQTWRMYLWWSSCTLSLLTCQVKLLQANQVFVIVSLACRALLFPFACSFYASTLGVALFQMRKSAAQHALITVSLGRISGAQAGILLEPVGRIKKAHKKAHRSNLCCGCH